MRDYEFLNILSRQKDQLFTETERQRVKEIATALERTEKDRAGMEECSNCHRWMIPAALRIIGDPNNGWLGDSGIVCVPCIEHEKARGIRFEDTVIHPYGKPVERAD